MAKNEMAIHNFEECATEGCGATVAPGEAICDMCGRKKYLQKVTELNLRLEERIRKLTDERNDLAAENMRLNELLKAGHQS